MEPEDEQKGQKRRVAVMEIARTGSNPFYVEQSTGRVLFDAEMLARAEYQELLRTLYTHYQRGGHEPLPFELFPVREVPEELLLELVNGDVRTFANLSASNKLMKARLKPLTARFVCERWPDVALLLAVACDLIQPHSTARAPEHRFPRG